MLGVKAGVPNHGPLWSCLRHRRCALARSRQYAGGRRFDRELPLRRVCKTAQSIKHTICAQPSRPTHAQCVCAHPQPHRQPPRKHCGECVSVSVCLLVLVACSCMVVVWWCWCGVVCLLMIAVEDEVCVCVCVCVRACVRAVPCLLRVRVCVFATATFSSYVRAVSWWSSS